MLSPTEREPPGLAGVVTDRAGVETPGTEVPGPESKWTRRQPPEKAGKAAQE